MMILTFFKRSYLTVRLTIEKHTAELKFERTTGRTQWKDIELITRCRHGILPQHHSYRLANIFCYLSAKLLSPH